MTDQKTTVRVGFQSDTQGLSQAIRQVKDLGRELEKLNQSSGASGAGGDGYIAPRHTGGRGGIGGVFGSAGRGVMRGGAGAFAAIGVATGALSIITHAVAGAKQYLSVLDPLTKQLSIVNSLQGGFAASIERTGEAIGKNKTEMMRLTQMYVGMTGQQGGRIARQVNVASLLSKGMGVDAGTMISSMGGMAQMGAYGQYGGMRVERFAASIADAVARGGMKGREAELFSSIQSLMGAQLNVMTRLAPGSSGAMIGALTAMNASGQPGLMGVRGANVLSRMNQGFMNPQGDFGEYFMYNALGRGDYFDYQMRKEQGIFGKGNLEAVMGHLKKTMPNEKARWFTMSKMFGISMNQAQSIDGLNLGGAGIGRFVGDLEKATGGDLSGVSADKLGLMAEIYNASGGRREALLGDSRISALAKKKGWTAQTDIQEILGGIAGGTMEATENEGLLSDLARLDNSMLSVGQNLLKVMEKILKPVADIAEALTGEGGPYKTPEQIEAWKKQTKDMSMTKKTVEDMPIAQWIGSIFDKIGDQIGKNLKLDVKITDERMAGDGSSVKVG